KRDGRRRGGATPPGRLRDPAPENEAPHHRGRGVPAGARPAPENLDYGDCAVIRRTARLVCWLSGVRAMVSANHALLLVKDGLTTTNASSGVVIQGVSGITLTQ